MDEGKPIAGAGQLAGSLSSTDAAQRRAAAESLLRMGPQAAPAVVELCRAAEHADETTREAASAALEELGPPREGDLPRLAELLASQPADAAYWAATLIGRSGESAEGQTAGLASALNQHASQSVRQRCSWALGQIGPPAAAALSALRKAAASDDPRLARLAAAAIKRIEP